MQKTGGDLNKRILELRAQCALYGRKKDPDEAAKARSALDGALIERSIRDRWDRLDDPERIRLAHLLTAGAA